MTTQDVLLEAIERAEAVNAHGHDVALLLLSTDTKPRSYTLDEVRDEYTRVEQLKNARLN